MIIHKCDKCGCLSEQKKGESSSTPNQWIVIRYDTTTYSSGQSMRWRNYELCPNCQTGLNIPGEEINKNVGERLLEILAEIAHEAVSED